jgi:hypothetical protein
LGRATYKTLVILLTCISSFLLPRKIWDLSLSRPEKEEEEEEEEEEGIHYNL